MEESIDEIQILSPITEERFKAIEYLWRRMNVSGHENLRAFYEMVLLILNIGIIILTIIWTQGLQNSVLTNTKNVISWIAFAFSVISAVVVWMRYSIDRIISYERYGIDHYSLTGTWCSFECVVMMIIHLIHPFHSTSSQQGWIALLVFVRLWPIGSLIASLTTSLRDSDEIRLEDSKTADHEVPNLSVSMRWRQIFHDHPFFALVMFGLVICLVASYQIYASEEQLGDVQLFDYAQSFYLAVMTFSNLGYGDFHPSSENFSGMVTSIFLGFLGIAFSGAVVAVMVSKFKISHNERLAFEIVARKRELRGAEELCRKISDLTDSSNELDANRLAEYRVMLRKKIEKLDRTLSYRDEFFVDFGLDEMVQYVKTQEKELMKLSEKLSYVSQLVTDINAKA